MNGKVGLRPTTSVCKACRQHKPKQDFKWFTSTGIYCSQGCATKAQWTFAGVPLPRTPREA